MKGWRGWNERQVLPMLQGGEILLAEFTKRQSYYFFSPGSSGGG